MNRQAIFKSLAKYYDVLYVWKDGEREAAAIARRCCFIHNGGVHCP